MGKTTVYKHSYLRLGALTAALAISTMTTIAFASDDIEVAAKPSEMAAIGRFVVTPKSSIYIPAQATRPQAE